jgi:hypothetical protein
LKDTGLEIFEVVDKDKKVGVMVDGWVGMWLGMWLGVIMDRWVGVDVVD